MLNNLMDTFFKNMTNADAIQTECKPPLNLHEYAANFQRDSSVSMRSRSRDGLSTIDRLVTRAARTRPGQAPDYNTIAPLTENLLRELYKWMTGTNPSNNRPLSGERLSSRRDAVTTLAGGVYCWYKQSFEARQNEPTAVARMNSGNDIPLNFYNYRFSRSGYRISTIGGRLYRGDTRRPATLWQAGGFYPKMDIGTRFDPHLGQGASQQVISSTDDANLVISFAKYNPVYCPKRFTYVHEGKQNKPVAGFIYEFDKTGSQGVQVTGVQAGREIAFLAIPNANITRFKMRYEAANNQLDTSDWMYYNDRSVQNIKIEEWPQGDFNRLRQQIYNG